MFDQPQIDNSVLASCYYYCICSILKNILLMYTYNLLKNKYYIMVTLKLVIHGLTLVHATTILYGILYYGNHAAADIPSNNIGFPGIV